MQNWLLSAQFGEKLLSHSRAVCDREVDETWREETTSILNILSLVLATRDRNESKFSTLKISMGEKK